MLSIEETSLGYPITAIQDHVKEVSALCFTITTASNLPKPSTLYMVSLEGGYPASAGSHRATHYAQPADCRNALWYF